MIDRLNTCIINKYIEHTDISNQFEQERIRYGLSVTLSETEKILAILLIFTICGYVKEFIISFVVLMSLRIFIGGFHFSKNVYCFVFSLIFFIVTVFFSKYIVIGKGIGLIICAIALINIILFAPLKAKHRVLLKEHKKKKLKVIASVVLLLMIALYIMLSREISNIMIWTIMLQQIEIIYCVINQRRKRVESDEFT